MSFTHHFLLNLSGPPRPNLPVVSYPGAEVCLDEKTTYPSDAIPIVFFDAKVIEDASEVVIDWKCGPVTPCTNLWTDYQGNIVPIAFNKPWIDYQGNIVPITFECVGGGGGTEYTYFQGYFDADQGEYSTLDFDQTLLFTARHGEYVGAPTCAPYTSALPIRIISSGSTGSSTVSATSFVHKTSGVPTAGVNTTYPTVLDTAGVNEIRASWRQTLSGGATNTGQEAAAEFGFFFTDNISAIPENTNNYQYHSPFYPDYYHIIASPRFYRVRLPFGPGFDYGSLGRSDPREGYGNITPTYWDKLADLDLYDGEHLITVILRRGVDGIAKFLLYIDDVFVSECAHEDTFPAAVVPVWHYHNWQNPDTIITYTDASVSACKDFLTTYPVLGLGAIEFASGEESTFDLKVTPSFEVDFYTGEESTVEIATDSLISNVEATTGEVVEFELEIYPAAYLELDAFTGEEATVEISVGSLFEPEFYTGEEASCELTTAGPTGIEIDFYTGESGEVDLVTSISFGYLDAFTGENAEIIELETLEFYRFETGEAVEFELATAVVFEAEGYHGETSEVDLDVRPSEGMGEFLVATGESGFAIFSVLVPVFLYPNRISAAQEIYCEFDVNTSFDLLNTACCPIKDSHERIELNDQPKPDEHYSGDKTIITVDLSTRPRFSIDFLHGEHARTVNPNYLGQFNFYEGHAPHITNIDFEFVDFRLCYGNFVPDGDNTFIELISTYDDDCTSDIVYTGESATVQIQNNVQMDPRMYEGQYMTFDLELVPIMLFYAYTGEFVRVSNPEFSPEFYDGNVVTFDFEDLLWSVHTGESMTLGNLTTEYDVEFLEQGCLDNEFVPSDENGDPDMEKFNPVPLELEFFSHSIRARCF